LPTNRGRARIKANVNADRLINFVVFIV